MVHAAASLQNQHLAGETLGAQLEQLRPGTHLCPIYLSPAQRLHVLLRYFRGGLVREQQCLYFGDPALAEDLSHALRQFDQGASSELDRGALVLITTREPYTRDGHFDPEAMLAFHNSMSDRAVAAGFTGLRVAGEMSWVFGADIGGPVFLRFEALLNNNRPGSGRSVICQYDRAHTHPRTLVDVLRTHPVAVISEGLHDNVYYEPPDIVLRRGPAETRRVDWMMNQLQTNTRRKAVLFDLARIALEAAGAQHVMHAAAQMVGAELGLEFVQIHELVPPGDSVRLVATTGQDRAFIGVVEAVLPDSPFASEELRTGKPLIISNWATETSIRKPDALREASITSSLSLVIPLVAQGRVFGFLTASSRERRVFSDGDIFFLEMVAAWLASASLAAGAAESVRALVETAPDVMVRFDRELRITYVNPAGERAAGRRSDELVGKRSSEVGVAQDAVPRWEIALRQVWRTGRDQSFELPVLTALGERIYDARIMPETGPFGAVESVCVIARDVSEQRRLENERADLYHQLIAQQNRVQELLTRMGPERQPGTRRGLNDTRPLSLGARDRQILRQLALGRTNRQIAGELGLTTGTVRNLVARLLARMNVRDRTQAAVRAVELGLIEQSDP